MNQGCVTLDEVFAAAASRAASVVAETSGYLALALGDATSRASFAIDERAVLLTTEGSVTLQRRGEMQSPAQAAEALRSILARLLAFSPGSVMPALAQAARAREESDRGVDAVVSEIEAALIPVNRAAARRALARLARETIKAKQSGRLPAAPPAPPAPRTPHTTPAPPPGSLAPASVQPAARVVAPTPLAVTPRVVAPAPAEPAFELAAIAAPAVASPVAPAPRAPAPREATPAALAMDACFDAGVEACPEPTPTVLGMSLIDIDPQEHVDPADAIEPGVEASAARDPEPTGLVAVLAQPKEDPALAFSLRPSGLARTGLHAPPPTEGVPRRIAPREPAPAPASARPAPHATPPSEAPAEVATRADDLLASFTVAGADEAQMRATLASLRQIAGLDPSGNTIAPPAVAPRVELRLPAPVAAVTRSGKGAPAIELSELEPSAETPSPKRAATGRKPYAARGSTLRRFALAGFVVGLLCVAGATFARLRPELLATLLESRSRAAAAPLPLERAPVPASLPSASVAPAASEAPVDRLGGTRAERGSSQRPR